MALTLNDTEKKLTDLFDELVPVSGKADTAAGEIVRAVNRIVYRNWNDGDHIGVGYGRETCNPAARFLLAKCNGDVEDAICKMWGVTNDERYDECIDVLEKAVLAFLDAHPELKETENHEDMWDYRTDEDVDDYEDDEEEY